VEPFLRDKPTLKRSTPQSNPQVNTTPQKTTTNKPVAKSTPKKTTSKTPTAPVKKPPVNNKPIVANKPKPDTAKRNTGSLITKEEVKKPVAISTITIPTKTRSRENELAQTINVTSGEVTVRLYDNGEIDDDTISVYMDDQLVLSN
jgi:hypothetical protein